MCTILSGVTPTLDHHVLKAVFDHNKGAIFKSEQDLGDCRYTSLSSCGRVRLRKMRMLTCETGQYIQQDGDGSWSLYRGG